MHPHIEIIYEGEGYLVINKPAGMLVHSIPGKESKDATVVSWLLKHYPQVANVGDDPETRPGIVHRLDRDTSGVMIVCLTQDAFDFFKKQFQEKTITKTYTALVFGEMQDKAGTINKPIGIKVGSVKRTVHHKGVKMPKEAITDYRVMKTIRVPGDIEINRKKQPGELVFTLVHVMPRTGRTHQIRIHLASIGHPIVSDSLYGKKKQPHIAGVIDEYPHRHFLHAESIECMAPNDEMLHIGSDLPSDLQGFLVKIEQKSRDTEIS